MNTSETVPKRRTRWSLLHKHPCLLGCSAGGTTSHQAGGQMRPSRPEPASRAEQAWGNSVATIALAIRIAGDRPHSHSSMAMHDKPIS
jgi:hypothetical protein